MKNVAIFASGNGSNFQALMEANLNCNIVLLVCDNADAYVIERAKHFEIEVYVFNPKQSLKKVYELKIIEKLEACNIDLIVLAGYMRLFSKSFVDKYPKRIINIHPSKLPKYAGLNAIEQAVCAGEEEIGVTIHYVDDGIDSGEIITCECVCIKNLTSIEEIEGVVHQLEHQLYPKVLKEKIL